MDEFREKKRQTGRALIFGVLGLVFVILFFGIASFIKNTAEAATPPTIISYQGKLLVGSSLASTTLSMTFKLYDDPTAGSEKYSSGAVSVTPTSGLFSVELGGTDGAAIDPTIFKDNAALYLQVSVAGEDMSPRKRITASPYALNALYLDGRIATSTPTSTSYVPLADSSGNFNFNKVTSTEIYVSGTSTFLNGAASIFDYGNNTILSVGSITGNPGVLSILGTAENTPVILLGTGDVITGEGNLSLDGGNDPTIALNYNSVADNGLLLGANVTGAYIESKPTSTTLKFLSNLGDSFTSITPFEFRTASTLTSTSPRWFSSWSNGTDDLMALSMSGVLLVKNLGATISIETPDVNVLNVLTVGTAMTIGGVDYTPFFINATGTTGQLWQSDGDGRGAWVSTTTLGLIGDLPPGTTGQIFRYGASAWEATSSLFIADTGFVGIGTTTPQFKLSLSGDAGIMAGGTYGSGTSLATSSGSQFIWYPRKSAIMVGRMDAIYEYWSDSMLGEYSASFGYNNRVGAVGAFAAGYGHQANGDYAVALGFTNQASAVYSVGIGSNNLVLGNYGTVIGHSNRVDGDYSYAFGQSVTTNATSSFAWGKNFTLTTDYSLGIGLDGADFVFTPGAGTATNTITFSTATVLDNNVASTTGALAYILNASNFSSLNPDQYILSLRSNNTPVFSVASNGNVHALGTLSASSATVGTPGTPGDLAERVDIAIDDTVEAGDVLVVDPVSPDTYRRSNGSYDQSVSGVVSTNPTIVVGNGKTNYTATMAMVGRVPVKASAENGPINRGDLLVSASIPGHAMRYDPQKDDTKVVGVIGVALDPIQSGTGKIMALIRTGWVYNRNQSITEIKSNLETLAAVQGLSLGSNPNSLEINNSDGTLNYAGGNLNLQGFALLNVGRVIGNNGRWLIDGNGRLISKVNTSEGEKTLYAVNSYNDELIISGSDKLVSGEARIVFDTPTKEIINSDETLKVNVTLTSGEAKGIYVKEKSQEGFVIKEVEGGQSSATFDWVVIAKRKAFPTPEPPVENTTPTALGGNSDTGTQPTTPPEENTPPVNEPNPVGQDSSETTNPDPLASDSSSESTEAPPASETPVPPPITPPAETPPPSTPTPEPAPATAPTDSSPSSASEAAPTS